MSSTIQIKRGNKINLPTLLPGEPAFTLDTKELFIGDGNSNYKITATNKNLIINGNFQVSFDTFDASSNTITILPGESKYIYGNYYLQNSSSSIGTVIVSRTFTDGFITINGVNSTMSLEYREKLPRYTKTTGDAGYSKPLEGKKVTMSYDIVNNMVNSIVVKSGGPSDFTSYSLSYGAIRKAITFTMSYEESGSYPIQKIILFATTTNTSFSINIGNIKVEPGNVATIYSPNPLYYDISMLNRICFSCSSVTKAIQITANTLKFNVPTIVPSYYNYGIKLINESFLLINITGSTQVGYTVSSSYNETTTSIDIICTKVNHGMTDAYILTKQFLDLRPY